MKTMLYDNRELSWLKFNKRVLEEAEDSRNPLCERLSFLSIFQSNLDEFDMVRVGSILAKPDNEIWENKTNMTVAEQIKKITEKEIDLYACKNIVYKNVMGLLEQYGVKELRYRQLTNAEQDFIHEYFLSDIKPFISPQVVGKRHPFPFLKNKEIYAVVELLTKSGNIKIGIIPCSGTAFDRMTPINGDKKRFMLVEELILHFAGEIFDQYHIKSKSLIRIIRSAEIDVDESLDDESDYLKAVETALKHRNKLSPTRLMFSRAIDDSIVKKMCDFLNVGKNRVFHSDTPLDLSFLYDIQDLLRYDKSLFYERLVPQQPAMINPSQSVTEQVRRSDILLSYPYESIKPFINLLFEAAYDVNVISIKMTLYRLAANSKIVEALIEAAENGKEVVVLVELRARFDEKNNIASARALEAAGCRVIYGLDRLKVHSKLCLITSRINNMPKYITQIGTGNYNEKTSALYTDYSLITSSYEIGSEVSSVLNSLAMGKTVEHTNHILAAPKCLQNKIIDLIDCEIEKAKKGADGYVGIKINSLTDKLLIDKLIEASRAGVHVDMIVRGICCLKAGIKNETDNIHVISIIGRFLEHSRIYIFGKNDDAKVYISSADFMSRNTTRRVEVAAPVYDKALKKRLISDFKTYLSDDVKARVQIEGNYTRRETVVGLNAQEYLYKKAYAAAQTV